MKEIARFFREVVIDKKDPKEVGKKVAEFRKEFIKVHYCIDISDEEAMKLLKLMMDPQPV